MDCRRRSSSCGLPKLVPLFNESGKLVPTSHRWGHHSPASAGLLLSPSAAGQGHFIFAYGSVAVANTDHVNVCGRSRGRPARPRARKHQRLCARRGSEEPQRKRQRSWGRRGSEEAQVPQSTTPMPATPLARRSSAHLPQTIRETSCSQRICPMTQRTQPRRHQRRQGTFESHAVIRTQASRRMQQHI
jgi:hypothetical protein